MGMYRKRRLKKVAKRCGLDPEVFRRYAMTAKKLRREIAPIFSAKGRETA